MGSQERSMCDEKLGCEIEERHCGQASNSSESEWSEWGPCIGGTQDRSTCGDVFGCEHEERPCAVHTKISEEGEWSEWEACVGGTKERLRCEEELSCEVEEQPCGKAAEVEGQFSGWSSCDEMGLVARSTCDLDFGCETQEMTCDDDESAVPEANTEAVDSSVPGSQWSEWEGCSEGRKLRDRWRCREGFECETEAEECRTGRDNSDESAGLPELSPVPVAQWSEWEGCSEGGKLRERQRCREGLECEVEAEECGTQVQVYS